MAAPGFTHERACAVIVEAPDVAARINEVRKACDPAYPRWMPHINLLYPMVEHARTTEQMLRNARREVAKLHPFTAEFDSVAAFTQRSGSASVHLHPSEATRQKLREIRRAVSGALAGTDDENFEPHLTIAVWPVPTEAQLPPHVRGHRDFCKLCWERFRGIEFPVTEVVIIDRNPQRGEHVPGSQTPYRFQVQHRFPLTGATEAARKATRLERRLITAASAHSMVRDAIRASMLQFAVKKASLCIRRLGTQRKLPRTVGALRNLLRPFTQQRVLLDVDEVMKRLLRMGVINAKAEMRPAPAPPGAASRGRGRGGAAPAARGRGGRGRGRGGRAEPVPAAPKIRVDVVTLNRAKIPSAAAGENAMANRVDPYGDATQRVFDARLMRFLQRLSAAQERNRAEKSQSRPFKVTEAGFRRELQDVCTVRCLVPADDIVEALIGSGAVGIPNPDDGDAGTVHMDASRV